MCYYNCERWQEALQDFLLYLPTDPDNKEVKVCASRIYIDDAEVFRTSDKLEKALEYFDMALKLDSSNLVARLGRARCLVRLQVRSPYLRSHLCCFMQLCRKPTRASKIYCWCWNATHRTQSHAAFTRSCSATTTGSRSPAWSASPYPNNPNRKIKNMKNDSTRSCLILLPHFHAIIHQLSN